MSAGSPLLAALLLSGASPPDSDQFDLDCSGPMTSPSQYITQAHVHFRFDMKANKWCEADCGQVHDILEVQPVVIYLDKSPDNTPAKYLHYRQINRETGQYTYADKYVFEAAVCSKRPFSGFPLFKAKF